MPIKLSEIEGLMIEKKPPALQMGYGYDIARNQFEVDKHNALIDQQSSRSVEVTVYREKLALLLFIKRERLRNLSDWNLLSYHRKLYWFRLADAIIKQKNSIFGIRYIPEREIYMHCEHISGGLGACPKCGLSYKEIEEGT